MKFTALFASILLSVSIYAPVLAQNSTLQACRSNMFGKMTNSCISVPEGTSKIIIQTEKSGQIRFGFAGRLGFAISELSGNEISAALLKIEEGNSLVLPDGTQIPITRVKAK